MTSASRHSERVKNPGPARGPRPDIPHRPDPSVHFRMTMLDAVAETVC